MGAWQVLFSAGPLRDMAKPFVENSPRARNRLLTGQYGELGAPNSVTLTGKINAEGGTLPKMVGHTAGPGHTAGHVDLGSALYYTANVYFDDLHGSGKRNELLFRLFQMELTVRLVLG
jgi:hypothetical protein